MEKNKILMVKTKLKRHCGGRNSSGRLLYGGDASQSRG
jgi:hypothetical protein